MIIFHQAEKGPFHPSLPSFIPTFLPTSNGQGVGPLIQRLGGQKSNWSESGKGCKRHKNWQRRTPRKTCGVTIIWSLFFDSWWIFFWCLFPQPGLGTVRLGERRQDVGWFHYDHQRDARSHSQTVVHSNSPSWESKLKPLQESNTKHFSSITKSFEDLMKGIFHTFPFWGGLRFPWHLLLPRCHSIFSSRG